MNETITYKVIEDTVHVNFVKAVNKKIAEGFVPQGGVSVCWHETLNTKLYSQAMIKTEPK